MQTEVSPKKPTPPAAPLLLACPFCGSRAGYKLQHGSTHRWWLVDCASCGRQVDECRADPHARYDAPPPDRWRFADEAWNEAATHAAALQALNSTMQHRIDELRAMIDRMRNDSASIDWLAAQWERGATVTVEAREPERIVDVASARFTVYAGGFGHVSSDLRQAFALARGVAQ